MNNKKGFTLFEFITSLFIISLIIGISIVTLTKKTETDEEKTKREYKEVATVVDVISEKLASSNSLKSYVYSENANDGSNGNSISFFCLKKKTIFDLGIFTDDNIYINNLTDSDLLKVKKDSLGNIEYEKTTNLEDCKYTESTLNDDVSVDIVSEKNDEVDGYRFDASIDKDSSLLNTFNININKFDYNVAKATTTTSNTNIYTIFALDGSGSMGKDGYNAVKEAVISLYNNMKGDNRYFATISFSSNVYRINNAQSTLKFSSTIYDNYFDYKGGGTDYYSPLSTINNAIKDYVRDGEDVHNRFFIIFLTDGQASNNYSTVLNNIKKFLRPNFVKDLTYKQSCENLRNNNEIEYGKLITVGYNYSSNNLKLMSSCNCNSSDNCYYSVSNSTNLTKVYTNFEEVINNSVSCTVYKSAKIKIDLGENFKSLDGKDFIESEYLALDCENKIENQMKELLNNATYQVVFNRPKTNRNDQDKNYPVIENIELNFYDGNENLSKTVSIEVPDNFVNLSFTEKDAIN